MDDRYKIRTEEMLKGQLLEPLDFPPRAEVREMVLVQHRIGLNEYALLIFEKDGTLVAVSDPRSQRDYSK